MMKVAIIGAAESGIGAALLAKKKGDEVFVSDYGEIPKKYKDELIENNIPFEEKGHHIERLIDAGLVIKSPGVPETAPILSRIKEEGTDIISEIEFGFKYYSGKVIAITGSNGKTTTSGLIYHLLKTANFDVEIGGNYGISFARLLCKREPEWVVLELSSFQLDNIRDFRPDIGVLLNITPDHLDRYEYNMMLYAAAKYRITENQSDKDHFIYNADDPIINTLLKEDNTAAIQHPIEKENYIAGIFSKEKSEKFEITIKGPHNLFNARCAVEAARIAGMSEEQIKLGLASFENAPHRMEVVANIDGVTFINDSKATNVDSVQYALEALESPIIWIAGGTDKGNDYTPLIDLARKKVKVLICLGIDNRKLVKAFAEHISIIIETTKVSNSVDNALDLANAGDAVILSPSCASFDLFENYIDRGDQFKRAVLNRAEGNKKKTVKIKDIESL